MTITFFATDWKWQNPHHGVPGDDGGRSDSKGSEPSACSNKGANGCCVLCHGELPGGE